MSKKLFKSGFIKVEPNQEIDLDPISLENENRGVIHGVVRDVNGKTCVAKLFKVKRKDKNEYFVKTVAFQYLDEWGQFLFPIEDTDGSTRYIVKIFCLDPEDCSVDPVMGNCNTNNLDEEDDWA